jgi:integrase
MDVPAATQNDAEDEAQRIIDSIQPRSVAGLRDRAIIALIAYAGGFLEEVVDMRIRDYLDGGNRAWVQLGIGDTVRLVEISPRIREYIEQYIAAANIRDNDSFSSLFRVTSGSWKHGVWPRGGYWTESRKHLKRFHPIKSPSYSRAFRGAGSSIGVTGPFSV